MRWSACVLAAAATVYEGKLVIPYQLPNDEGALNLSWWTSEDGPMSTTWKKEQLKLSNTILEVLRVGESKPFAIIPVSETGTFSTPDVDTSDVGILLRPSHPAYVWSWALIDDGKLFLVDGRQGIHRNMRKLNTLALPAVQISSPHKNPTRFSIWGFVKNPLVIMGLGMLVVSYGLPALTGGMNLEEMRRESGLSTAADPATQFQGSFLPHVKKSLN